MKAIILSIGDELVLGQTVDTNAAWLSAQLAAVGIDVIEHITVPDDQPAIERSLQQAASRSDFVIATGGLGPTADDLTRQALATVLGEPLELHAPWLAEIEAMFARRNWVMAQSNRIQAMIPRGAGVIWNTRGTAAGISARIGACLVFILPGVPVEMKTMFQQSVLPLLSRAGSGRVVLSRTLHTFGIGESRLGELLGDLMQRGRNPSVGTTVSQGIVSVRINSRSDSVDEAQRQLDQTEQACRQRLGSLVYGADQETLAQVVIDLLKRGSEKAGRNLTVTTAESCTGGLIAKTLTDVPGASLFFRQGWIVYANEAKRQLVGVPEPLLRDHGAVSEPVVRCMAANALLLAEADFAIAVSGIAGPDGGTTAKPVGTVWLALASDGGEHVTTRCFVFPPDRESVRDRAAKMALSLLRYRLLGAETPF